MTAQAFRWFALSSLVLLLMPQARAQLDDRSTRQTQLEPTAAPGASSILEPSADATGRDPARVPLVPKSTAVDPGLLSILHACMSAPELRPAPGPFEIAVSSRILQDCLGETPPREVLQKLTAALQILQGEEQDDAVLLVAYLARQLLDESPSAAEKAAILEPVLGAYRTIEGPRLRSAATQLILDAYFITSDEKAGVAIELGRSIERELEAGPAIHVLGPLLQATETARLLDPVLETMDPADPRSPKTAIGEMLRSVKRAIPMAIELGLEAISSSDPYKLRDGLHLLQHVFLASPEDSSQLIAAAPRVLDALARLDPRPIERSGLPKGALDSLLAQTEIRLRAAGALDRSAAPIEGGTSPAELRQRFGIPALPPGSIRIKVGENEWIVPQEPR